MLSSSSRKSKIEIGAASLYQELGLLELLLVEGVPILFRVSLKHSFARPVVLFVEHPSWRLSLLWGHGVKEYLKSSHATSMRDTKP